MKKGLLMGSTMEKNGISSWIRLTDSGAGPGISLIAGFSAQRHS